MQKQVLCPAVAAAVSSPAAFSAFAGCCECHVDRHQCTGRLVASVEAETHTWAGLAVEGWVRTGSNAQTLINRMCRGLNSCHSSGWGWSADGSAQCLCEIALASTTAALKFDVRGAKTLGLAPNINAR